MKLRTDTVISGVKLVVTEGKLSLSQLSFQAILNGVVVEEGQASQLESTGKFTFPIRGKDGDEFTLELVATAPMAVRQNTKVRAWLDMYELFHDKALGDSKQSGDSASLWFVFG